MKKIIVLLLLTNFCYGQDILTVANSYLGKRAGNGICWQYIKHVLKDSKHTIGEVVENPRPGDICMNLGKKDSLIPILDKYGDCYAYRLYGGREHIMIITKVLGNNTYEVLEQNANGKRDPVSRGKLDLNAKPHQDDWGATFYRPTKGKLTKEDIKTIRYFTHAY